MTLAFLGNVDFEPLERALKEVPLPAFPDGLGEVFDRILLLPPRSPRVVAWHTPDPSRRMAEYQKELAGWLEGIGYALARRDFLPHLTIARRPFSVEDWNRAFVPMPYQVAGLHLYETVGSLVYRKVWSHPLPLCFHEIAHSTGRAFLIRGENFDRLLWHAQLALFWKEPVLGAYLERDTRPSSLNEVIIALNEVVSRADHEEGSPLKAVSFHGEAVANDDGVLEWEMIVGV